MQQRELIDETIDEPAPLPLLRPQRKFKSKRAWQLAVLEQMVMPDGERSNDDRPVKPRDLALLFRTIDNRARENGWYQLPIDNWTDRDGKSRRGLAAESHLSVRQCKRALQVAMRKGWLERQGIRVRSGAMLWQWRLVFQELARTTTLPLWSDAPGPEPAADADRVPNSPPARAQFTASTCPTGGDRVPNSLLARAHAGTQEAPTEKRPWEPPQPPPSESSDEWAAAVGAFRGQLAIGKLRDLAAKAKARGEGAARFREHVQRALDIASCPANAFTSPGGAAMYFLEQGVWPRDGVVTPERQAELDVEQRARDDEQRAREEAASREAAQRQAQKENYEAANVKYGPVVDALDADGIAELRPHLSADGVTAVNRAILPHSLDKPWPFAARLELLRACVRRDADREPRPREAEGEPP